MEYPASPSNPYHHRARYPTHLVPYQTVWKHPPLLLPSSHLEPPIPLRRVQQLLPVVTRSLGGPGYRTVVPQGVRLIR
eukprot:423649-Hanusia_phi.AAC.1